MHRRAADRIDFFIAGVQKGGTTALHHYLSQHKSIGMSPGKELHFFDRSDVDWCCPDLTVLHRHFSWDCEHILLRGEATPNYVYWPEALERIRDYNPEARIIICLRHPAYRAYSAWRMERARGKETLPFHEAIRAPGRARVGQAPNGVHRNFSYVERGFYAAQIESLLRLFAREQLLFLRSDDLFVSTRRCVRAVHQFLAVPDEPPADIRSLRPIEPHGCPDLPAQERRYLDELFRRDLMLTQELTGLALTDWLEPDYVEPIR